MLQAFPAQPARARAAKRSGLALAAHGAAALAAALLLGASPAAGQKLDLELNAADCGKLQNAVGPFDYRKHRYGSAILKNVETNHFNEGVENLERGESSYIGADLDYVLRAFPNHHPALFALSRLAREKVHSERILGLHWPVSCYFIRAIEFAPDDATVHGMFAVHLSRLGKRRQALAEIDAAIKFGATDANTLYNAGLIHFDVKDYDKALEYAQQAYAAGFPLPGLRNKLKAVGKWQEPPQS